MSIFRQNALDHHIAHRSHCIQRSLRQLIQDIGGRRRIWYDSFLLCKVHLQSWRYKVYYGFKSLRARKLCYLQVVVVFQCKLVEDCHRQRSWKDFTAPNWPIHITHIHLSISHANAGLSSLEWTDANVSPLKPNPIPFLQLHQTKKPSTATTNHLCA